MAFKRYKLFLLIFIVMLMNGCAVNQNLWTSVAIVKSDAERNRIIINDLLGLLQRYYAPAKTTFVINPDKSRENLKFAEQFENRFRNAGYAISHDNSVKAIPLSWKIDRVGRLVRATYYINRTVITRVYKNIGASWIPVGPFSAQNIGSPKYNPALLKELTVSSRQKRAVYAKIVANILRIREKPTVNSKIVGYLKQGQKVRVTYKLKNSAGELWVKLKHSKGYILSKYVRILRGL